METDLDYIDTSWLTDEHQLIRYNRKVLKLLYDMVFPFRSWDYDYLSAAYNLVKEVKGWCRPHLLPNLLMLGRAMDMDFSAKDAKNLAGVCKRVVDKIMDIGLIAVKPYQSSLVISFSTGIPPHINSSEVCQNLLSLHERMFRGRGMEYIILSIISNVTQDIDYQDITMLERLNEEDGRLIPNSPGREGFTKVDYSKEIKELENTIRNKLRASKRTYREMVEVVKDIEYEASAYQHMASYVDMMFLKYLIELLIGEELAMSVSREELCSTPQVQNFNKWLAQQSKSPLPKFNLRL